MAIPIIARAATLGIRTGGKIALRLNASNVRTKIERMNKQLELLPKKAHNFFVKETPIKSGNARRKTVLKGDTIEANYEYANRLNDGHSRQAPKGMTEPTISYVRGQVRKILGN